MPFGVGSDRSILIAASVERDRGSSLRSDDMREESGPRTALNVRDRSLMRAVLGNLLRHQLVQR